MKDELISFETAKLAKEKGFDLKVVDYFSENSNRWGGIYQNWNNKDHEQFGFTSAPTQSLLQRWLREKHKMLIVIEYYGGYYRCEFPIMDSEYYYIERAEICETYEQALEKGLYEALKLIDINTL